MRSVLLTSFLSLFFIALHAQDAKQQKTVLSASELSKQEACEVLGVEEIANLLNTEVASLIEEDMSFVENDRRSICHYVVKDKGCSFNVQLSWKSEKAQTNKVLEQSYNRFLSTGEKEMKNYQELKSSGETQILYGTQRGRLGTNHLIRKRFGNSAEVKIEIVKEEEDKEMMEQLLEAVESMK